MRRRGWLSSAVVLVGSVTGWGVRRGVFWVYRVAGCVSDCLRSGRGVLKLRTVVVDRYCSE